MKFKDLSVEDQQTRAIQLASVLAGYGQPADIMAAELILSDIADKWTEVYEDFPEPDKVVEAYAITVVETLMENGVIPLNLTEMWDSWAFVLALTIVENLVNSDNSL